MAGGRIGAEFALLTGRGGQQLLGDLQGQLIGCHVLGDVGTIRLRILDIGAVASDPDIDAGFGVTDREGRHGSGIDVAEVGGHVVQAFALVTGGTVEEVVEHLQPLGVAARDFVQFVFQGGGELVVDQPREVLDEQAGDRERQPGRHQRGALLVDVVAGGDGADDRCIGRRAPDFELFELGDQRRLGVAGRGLSLMALGRDLGQVEMLVGGQLGQLGLFTLLVVGDVGIGLEETREGNRASRGREDGAMDVDGGHFGAGPQPLRQFGSDLHRHRLTARICHLGGDGALPDQFVEPGLVTDQLGLRGGAEGVAGGPDGLVGFLRVLHLGRVDPRRGRHVIVAVQRAGLLAGGRDGLLRQRDRIGTHISDVARFVELLGDPHGAVGREAELASGLLLQGRGAERRGGTAGERLGLHRVHREAGLLQRLGEVAGALLVHHEGIGDELAVGIEVGAASDLPVVQAGEPGIELARCRGGAGIQGGEQIPVGRRGECHPLAFAVDDQPGRDRLHASGRQLRHDLLPQHRGDLVAVEPVQDASGLLGVHQVDIELAGVGDGRSDGFGGDLVEDHPLDRHLGLQFREQMPGDGLPFAVLISCQIELVDVLEQLFEFTDDRLLVGADNVQRREIVLDVDAEPGPGQTLVLRGHLGGVGGQVADVAAAGLHDVARSQEACEHGRLGGRLDDHQSAGCIGHVAVLQGQLLSGCDSREATTR